MKISVAQFSPKAGALDENVERMVRFVAEASAAGSKLVVFPEMCDTGYDMPTIVESAPAFPGPPLAALQDAASEHVIAIVAGVSERAGTRIFNTQIAIDASAELVAKYRKTHLITAAPTHEETYLQPGDELIVTELAGIKIGMMICYDIRFPEVARSLALQGAELLVISACWPLLRVKHWDALAHARAIENQLFVAAAGRNGSDSNLTYAGSSRIVDPYGVALAEASTQHECVISAELPLERIGEFRKLVQCFDDRRPKLYDIPVDRTA